MGSKFSRFEEGGGVFVWVLAWTFLSMFQVSIQTPRGDKTTINLQDVTANSVSSAVKSNSLLCWYTHYNLEAVPDCAETKMKMVMETFTEQDVIFHAQHTARIIFTLSERKKYSDCSQSVVGWITRNFQNKMPSTQDVSGFYPKNYIDNVYPSLINNMDFSSYRVIQGNVTILFTRYC